MTNAEALALLEQLSPHLDDASFEYAAAQWLECRADWERADWFERMRHVLSYWESAPVPVSPRHI